MSTRQVKQLIYGGAALLVVLGIVVWIYSGSRPAPSCFDNIQNQGEAGVDCGGPCAKVCLPATLSSITTLGSVSVFTPMAGHVTVLAQVADTNTGFAAQGFGYHFDLYDAAGSLLGSAPGQSFLYAGEVKYLVAPNLLVATSVDHAALVIGLPDWVSATTLGLVPQFNLQNIGTPGSASSSSVSVNGQISDEDAASFSNVLIIGIFYDTGNNMVGASQTEIDRIAPNQTEQFSIVYPAVPNLDPLRTKFFAYALR